MTTPDAPPPRAAEYFPEEAPEAAAFEDASNDVQARGTKLLVAVGDNFAPFFLSREMTLNAADIAKVTKDLSPKQREAQFPWKIDPVTLDDKTNYEADSGESWKLYTGDPSRSYLEGLAKIPTDNVACFMTAMGFDAVTPGPQDFYYGPERLRQLAQFLRDPKRSHPTRMLASNLYIAPQYVDLNQPLNATPYGVTSGPARKAPQAGPNAPQAVLPKAILPWMRAITVKNAFDAAGALAVTDVCAIKVDPGIAVPGDVSLNDCKTSTWHFTPDHDRRQDAETTVQFSLRNAEPIIPGKYRICLMTATPGFVCKADAQQAVVQLPFLEYPAGMSPGGKAAEESLSALKPWVYKDDGGQKVAVFGVVGATLIDSVGTLNSMWLYRWGSKIESNRQIQIQAAATADTLRQIFQYCELVTECQSARKVLLAQMPEAEAYELIPQLVKLPMTNPVDVIVAQADPDHETGQREITRPVSAHPAPTVVTPGSFFNHKKPYELDVHANAVTVIPCWAKTATGFDTCTGGGSQSVITDVTQERPLTVEAFPGQQEQLKQAANPRPEAAPTTPKARIGAYIAAGTTGETREFREFRHAAGLEGAAATLTQAKLESLALFAMRETCHADVAMLQHRDVTFPDAWSKVGAGTVDELYQLVSAIFWKGDFVICQNLTGDTINSVLKASKQFEDDEANGLATELSSGWGLATMGADPDAKDDPSRRIDGQLLDPKRLYSVALTDYLSTGSTGYPMLQGAEPPPLEPWTKQKLISLRIAVGHMINDHQPPPKSWFESGAAQLDQKDLTTLIPTTNRQAVKQSFVYPARPKYTTFTDWASHLFSDFTSKSACGNSAPQKSVTPNCVEELAQQKPVWWIDLYKADISYSLFLHNGSEASIAQRFPGVTSVTLNTAENNTKAADYILRIERDSQHFAPYFQSSLNYGYRLQRGTSGNSEAYQPSQTAEYWYHELGFGYRFGPPKEDPSGWKAVVAAGLQTQPSRPFTQFSYTPANFGLTGSPPSSSGSASPVVARRSVYFLQHAGLRYDFTYPKPKTPQAAAGGGGGASSAASSSGGGGGKGGKGGGGASSSSSSGGGSQTQTFNTFLEFGLERGTVYHGVSQFNFAPTLIPVNGSLASDPAARSSCSVSDSACIEAVVAAEVSEGKATKVPGSTPVYAGTLTSVLSDRTHQQRGFYFNFRLDAPLPLPLAGSSEFVLENRGSWYLPHADLNLDTRLTTDFKASLVIPIWQKLSISPSMELFFFQTQVSAQLYRSVTASASLSYSFEWHNGLKPKKAFAYGNPVPAQPSLPTK